MNFQKSMAESSSNMMSKVHLPSRKKRKAEQMVVQALVRLDDKNNDEARSLFNQALILGQDKIAPYMRNLFDGFVLNNRHAEAITIGKPLMTFFERDAALFCALGNQYRMTGARAEAAGCYKKSLEKSPGNRRAMLNLAALEAGVERYDDEINGLLKPLIGLKSLVVPNPVGEPTHIRLMARELLEQLGDEKAFDQLPENHVAPEQMVTELESRIQLCLQLGLALLDEEQREELRELLINQAIFATRAQDQHGLDSALSRLQELGFEYRYRELLKAIVDADRGETEGAEATLRRLQKSNPADRYYNANLGLLFKRLGKHFLASVFLIRAGFLLERSRGHYCMVEIKNQAERYFNHRKYNEAQVLFQIVADNEPSPQLQIRLGQCLYYKKRLLDAFGAFKKGFEIEMEAQDKRDFIDEVQSFYMEEAGHALKAKKAEKAHSLAEHALFFERNQSVLELAAKAAQASGEVFRGASYQEELNQLLGLDRNSQFEAKRQRHIQTAKDHLAQQNFQSAIHYFELAFEMKLDKDVFVYLANIYKRLKYQRALGDLMRRWKSALENMQNGIT
ncbi:MAG: hypothetical protein RRB13_12080 [bacterium]|nr:hypothetical protein [bacterium]